MADKKETIPTPISKEFIIPLRNEWRKVANYRRTGRAVKFIKEYIAKHMKVPDRDVSKVKLDIYLNQEIFFRGRKKPPAKLKVRAIKEEDLIRVELVDLPLHVKFLKKRQEKLHKPEEKKKESKKEDSKAEEKKDEKKDDETPEEKEEKKKEEKEKSTSVAEQKAQQAEKQAKDQKHVTSVKEPKFHRQALKK